MAKHTNRLINESSPYLLQHAHNPVDWYPWGDEALQKAKDEDKPILVSIGYAACHWCHVMERESFEDEETAALMNEHFVNIKIDREERPDLDHIYMDAVQAIAGNGGWPLNVFLMPGGKPFYGGTYFPPKPLYNRSSWKEVLQNIYRAYKEQKHELVSQAENLTAHLTNANAFGSHASNDQFSAPDLDLITANILKQADKQWGGFGTAPKFPQTFSIQYLLRDYYFNKNQASLDHALLSLDKMIYGGIYDQLGGGFARYSTDAEWLAPHFEKMLYDNALLLIILSEAFQLTKKELYRQVIDQTISFIQRELKGGEDGFFSALDADSEHVEGKFYTWSKKEIQDIIGVEAPIFTEFYDVSELGNWEHTNILRVKVPLEEFAALNNMDVTELEVLLQRNRKLLMNERDKRIRPALDDKILLGWNALMVTALTKAYAATLNESYKGSSIATIEFLETKLNREGTWFHTYKNGTARVPAFLDDLAYLVSSYIHLQEITGNEGYLLKARRITEYIINNFSDENDQMFYYTHKDQQDVIVRKKEIYDGATPSGNAVMAFNLRYLAKVFDMSAWEERANGMLLALKNVIIKYPGSFAGWAQQVQDLLKGVNEIAIVGDESMEYLKELLSGYYPNKIVQASLKGNEKFPLLSNRKQDETRVYLCKNYVCTHPLANIEALIQELK